MPWCEQVRERPTSTQVGVSKSMKANRASGTRPELLLSELLGKEIKKNSLPGKPDFVFQRKKVAVFLNGCFWHRCPQCAFKLPKRNRRFWAEKFERNRERDRRVTRELRTMGWKVVVVWEHELKRNPARAKDLTSLPACAVRSG